MGGQVRSSFRSKRPTFDRIAQLETLVDELIKDAPEEERIRSCVKAAGLAYSANHVTLMERVLVELEGARERTRAVRSESEII